jgi:VWFA-related protein
VGSMRSRSIAASICAAVAVALPVARALHAQTFTAQANLVEVDAVVTDSHGRLVPGLTADRFALYEDGRKVPITAFEAVDLGNASDGRLLTIVMDDLTGPLTPRMMANARAIARGIVNGLAPNDAAWVLTTSGRSGLAAAYTSDKYVLTTAIDHYGLSVGSSRRTLDLLADLSRELAAVPHKRKAVVFISANPYGNPSGFEYRDREQGLRDLWSAIQAAQTANVAYYTFDPRGLPDYLHAEAEGQSELAFNTGGWSAANTNTFDDDVARVLAETRSYYLLGYVSAAKPDGATHSIRVNVDVRGLDVRARPSVTLPKKTS